MKKPLKVMLTGPIDTKGRYQGGIAYIINTILNSDYVNSPDMAISSFDTCRIRRSGLNTGSFSIDNLKNTVATVKDLKKTLKRVNPDILYFNTSRGYALLKDLFVISAVKRYCKKIILHIHFGEASNLVPQSRLFKRLFVLLINKYVDKIVLLSKVTMEQLTVWGISPSKMKVIYNFHNLDISDEEIESKVDRIKNAEINHLIFIGSLDKRKGILDLIKAIDEITIPVVLHICGTAKSKDVDDKLIRYAKTHNNIILHGFVDGEEKKKLLLDSAVMILPSYGEGFPIVLVEGIAASCAIIATNVGAIPEVFSDKNGKIISPGDIASLKLSIENLCKSEQLEIIIRNNRKLSLEFSFDKFYNEIKTACLEVANEA